MAMRKSEIQGWLDTIPGDPMIAIDEGGLTLIQIGPNSGSVWCEVGGEPEEEE